MGIAFMELQQLQQVQQKKYSSPTFVNRNRNVVSLHQKYEQRRMEVPNGAFNAGKRDEWGHQTKSNNQPLPTLPREGARKSPLGEI